MTRCKPVKLRRLDASRVIFSLRCGQREYAGWRAVRCGNGVAIIPSRYGPGLTRASLDALCIPVFVAWKLRGVGTWPE